MNSEDKISIYLKEKEKKKKKVRGSAFSLSFNRNMKSITWKQSRYYIK